MQKGCARGSQGSKEQLIIDSIISHQVQTKQRNLHTCYIDYSKAFDSVPHNWMLKVLQLYKIHPAVQNLLQYSMSAWETELTVNNISIERFKIRRGIFQGDSLSPTWFCLALNPLSALLDNSGMGYRITKSRVSHMLYMDDLKLMAESKAHISSLVKTTKIFSHDIKMTFGLEKCYSQYHQRKGSVCRGRYLRHRGAGPWEILQIPWIPATPRTGSYCFEKRTKRILQMATY